MNSSGIGLLVTLLEMAFAMQRHAPEAVGIDGESDEEVAADYLRGKGFIK